MPVVGDVHKVTRSEFEADVKTHMAGLAKVMPAGHMELINEHAPGIFPALAMDITLAQFVANMSEDGLKMLLRHAPQLIVAKIPSDAPQGGEWPGPSVAGGPAPQIPNWWTA